MKWVFLSPHFDDVVYSCGGMIWELIQAGETVRVWTVCAGAPAPDEPLSDFALQLHERWGTGIEAVAARRAEDEAALRLLHAGTRYWSLPDCIYRRLPDGWLVNGEDDLWQPVHPQEQVVVEALSAWIASGLKRLGMMGSLRLVSPLTLGDHVDHFLVRAAAERAVVKAHCALLYYPDYPYAGEEGADIAEKTGPSWQQVCQTVSDAALAVWQDAAARYASQLSTFWTSREALNAALEDYRHSGGGACLWQPGLVCYRSI